MTGSDYDCVGGSKNNWNYSGSGAGRQTASDTFSYNHSGTAQVHLDDPQYSFSSTFGAGGGATTSSDVKTDRIYDPNGSWRAAQTHETDAGNATNSYHYASQTTETPAYSPVTSNARRIGKQQLLLRPRFDSQQGSKRPRRRQRLGHRARQRVGHIRLEQQRHGEPGGL